VVAGGIGLTNKTAVMRFDFDIILILMGAIFPAISTHQRFCNMDADDASILSRFGLLLIVTHSDHKVSCLQPVSSQCVIMFLYFVCLSVYYCVIQQT